MISFLYVNGNINVREKPSIVIEARNKKVLKRKITRPSTFHFDAVSMAKFENKFLNYLLY